MDNDESSVIDCPHDVLPRDISERATVTKAFLWVLVYNPGRPNQLLPVHLHHDSLGDCIGVIGDDQHSLGVALPFLNKIDGFGGDKHCQSVQSPFWTKHYPRQENDYSITKRSA